MKRGMKITFMLFAVLFLISSPATAEIVSNSMIVDDIEYYMQTDDSIYNLGEDIEMLYRVTNLSSEEVTFIFGGSPEWNFWAEKNEENIWTAVEGWWAIGSGFTLAPSEYKEFPYIWDMRDNEDHLIVTGEYDMIGGLDGGTSISTKEYEFTEVSVPIAVVPEPCTLAFIMIGLPVLFRKRKKD